MKRAILVLTAAVCTGLAWGFSAVTPRERIVVSGGKQYNLDDKKAFEEFTKMSREDMMKLPVPVRREWARRLYRNVTRDMRTKRKGPPAPDSPLDHVWLKDMITGKKRDVKDRRGNRSFESRTRSVKLKVKDSNKIGSKKITLEAL